MRLYVYEITNKNDVRNVRVVVGIVVVVVVGTKHRQHKHTVNKLCGRPPQYAHAPASWPLTFDLESAVRFTCDVGYTSVPILVFLGFSVLDLSPMYTTDRRQSDRQTYVRGASSLNASALWGRGITSCAGCSAGATICPRPLQVVTWTATQSFQLKCHCTCQCGSLYAIHPFTKFEVRRLSRSEDMTDFPSRHFIRLVTLTLDILTLELVCKVTRGTDSPACNFGACATFLSSYGLTRVKLTTWRYNLDLWPWRSPWMSVMRVLMVHPYTKFDVRWPSRSEDMADFRS